jgi:hypothetical protein
MLLACALPRRGPGTGTRPVQGPHRPVAMASSTMPGRRLLLACPGSNGRVRRNRQPFGLILVFWFGGVGGAAGSGCDWGGCRWVRLACSDDDFLFGERSGRVVAQAHRRGGLCEAGALGASGKGPRRRVTGKRSGLASSHSAMSWFESSTGERLPCEPPAAASSAQGRCKPTLLVSMLPGQHRASGQPGDQDQVYQQARDRGRRGCSARVQRKGFSR